MTGSGGMAEKAAMHDTLEKEVFRCLTHVLRECAITPADSGSCPVNPVDCIVFRSLATAPLKYFGQI
jgi:hypothetical protein